MTLAELKKIVDEMSETLPPSIGVKIETGNYICECREAYAILPKTKVKYVLLSEHIEEYRGKKRAIGHKSKF